jgi:D-lactate dehydrogenase (cytochrome)
MDAIDLFIGSEGTLGIITKAKLKLLPNPEKLISCVVFFRNEVDALAFLFEARKISFLKRKNDSKFLIDALALEFFDKNSLKFLLPDYPNIPAVSGSAVWFEQETTIIDEERFLEEWTNLIRKFGGNDNDVWFTFSENENEKIQKFRHSISAKVNEFMTQNNFRKLGTDVAVPDFSFEELYYYSKKITEAAGINYVVYGHFGNSHMHFNFLPGTDLQFEKAKELYRTICLKAIELKGTVSAEHGVGKVKREYLTQMYGEDVMNKMFAIKKMLDPNIILGRGNLFE